MVGVTPPIQLFLGCMRDHAFVCVCLVEDFPSWTGGMAAVLLPSGTPFTGASAGISVGSGGGLPSVDLWRDAHCSGEHLVQAKILQRAREPGL